MKRILDGYRVLDWGSYHAGPGVGVILGALGADVIKIESRGATRPADGRSMVNDATNHNKRSIALDLSKAEGREIVYRLVEKSDVFVTNFRKSAVTRQGMAYETLKRYNPKLIYAGVSAFGWQGPDGDLGGFDFQGQARSGFMASMGEPGKPPVVIRFGVIDQTTAFTASFGVVSALLARERYGMGQELHASLLGSAMNLLYFNIMQGVAMGRKHEKHDRSAAPNPLVNLYRCRDDKWLACSHQPAQKWWPDFCRAFGISELIDDPRFNSDAAREQNARELVSILDGVFAARTRDECLQIAREARLVFAPLNEPSDLANDPQAIANNYIIDVDYPGIGQVKMPGFPIQFGETPARFKVAPAPGSDTDEVLMEVGGFDEAQLQDFKAREII